MGIFDFFKQKFSKYNLKTEEEKNKSKSFGGSTKSYYINEIDPILRKELKCHLLPGEIILLNWINKKTDFQNAPRYFEQIYGIEINNSINKLIKRNFLEHKQDISVLKKYTIAELKPMLGERNLAKKGKKAELVDRLANNLTSNEISKLPKVYTVTTEGMSILDKYEYIPLAHSDRYFNVSEAILYKNKMSSNLKYSDLKWSYLNSEANRHYLDQRFGSFRNVQLARYQQLMGENKLVSALSYCLLLMLLDFSGLGNNYAHFGKPFYENIMISGPGIYKELEKLNYLIPDEEYDSVFNKTIKFLSDQNLKGFLTEDDIIFLHKELKNLDIDIDKIEEYFKKYQKFSLDSKLKKLRKDLEKT